jgi:hypothetical protein
MDVNLGELAKQGLLGLLLAMSLTLNGILAKLLLSEKDKRIASAEKVRDDIATPLTYIKDSLGLIQEKVQIAKRTDHE